MSPLADFYSSYLQVPTIMDKSVDTVEQNKRFPSASFHNFKKHLFCWEPTPPPPFQCCNTLRGHFHLVTILKRGEGVEMSKLDIKKLARWTKRVFFRECLDYFCPWLQVRAMHVFCWWSICNTCPIQHHISLLICSQWVQAPALCLTFSLVTLISQYFCNILCMCLQKFD